MDLVRVSGLCKSLEPTSQVGEDDRQALLLLHLRPALDSDKIPPARSHCTTRSQHNSDERDDLTRDLIRFGKVQGKRRMRLFGCNRILNLNAFHASVVPPTLELAHQSREARGLLDS